MKFGGYIWHFLISLIEYKNLFLDKIGDFMEQAMKKQTQKWQLAVVVGLSVVLCACQTTQPSANNTTAIAATQGSNKSETARIRTQLAAQYIRENKLDIALQQLELAMAADSRYAPAYDMMGVLLQAEGSTRNLARADEYFRKALGIDPNFSQARNNYGVYLSKMHKYNEAIAQFEIAGTTLGYEGRAASLENMGRAYLALKNTDKAKASFLRALDANNQRIDARVELTDIFLNENNLIFAKDTYDAVLARVGNVQLPPRLLYQGIRIAHLQQAVSQRQKLAQQLLALYPLSDEAKKFKAWLANPNQPLK